MSKEFKTALVKALQELGRMTVIAVIPVAVSMLGDGSIDYRVLGITALIAFLKALDKLVHKYGQEKEDTTLEKGIVRF